MELQAALVGAAACCQHVGPNRSALIVNPTYSKDADEYITTTTQIFQALSKAGFGAKQKVTVPLRHPQKMSNGKPCAGECAMDLFMCYLADTLEGAIQSNFFWPCCSQLARSGILPTTPTTLMGADMVSPSGKERRTNEKERAAQRGFEVTSTPLAQVIPCGFLCQTMTTDTHTHAHTQTHTHTH